MARSQKPKSKKRTRRFRQAVIVSLIICNVMVGAAYLWLRSIKGAFGAAETDSDVVAALDVRTGGDDPITFLLVGTDSREGLEDLTHFGNFGGERSDVIILLKVIPQEKRALMLSIPRDTWVDIPGHSSNRINASYSMGGPTLLVETIKQNYGIPINHFAQVDLVGFKSLVDEIGGVTIDFPFAARDSKSGLSVEAGFQRLNGDQALAYARSRSYQEFRDGSWQSTDASDIGRTRRQQQLVFAILREVKRPSSLLDAGNIIESFAQYMTLDAALVDSNIVGLAFDLRSLAGGDIEALTLPTRGTLKGEAQVLEPKQPEAGTVLAAFVSAGHFVEGGDTAGSVAVLNANRVSGSAATVAATLESKGISVVEVGDSDAVVADTAILVRPGEFSRGAVVVGALGFGEVRVATLKSGVDVVVLVGLDLAGG